MKISGISFKNDDIENEVDQRQDEPSEKIFDEQVFVVGSPENIRVMAAMKNAKSYPNEDEIEVNFSLIERKCSNFIIH
jgi:hypothetical protein